MMENQTQAGTIANDDSQKNLRYESVEDPSMQMNSESWVDEHGGYLFHYAMSRVDDSELAEDLVQETFLGALRSSERFGGRSQVKTWLVGILKHKIVDHFREQNRLRPVCDFDTELSEDHFFEEAGRWRVEPAKWEARPDLVCQQKEFKTVLHRCLESLPPRHAEAFILRELEDMNTGEICEILNVSATNLGVMLHRARLKLRESLARLWLETPASHASPRFDKRPQLAFQTI